MWSAIFLFLVVLVLVFVSMMMLRGLLEKNQQSAEVLFGYVGGNTDVSILKQDITKANEVQKKLNGWLLDPRDTVDLVTYVETISDKVGLNPTIENLNAQKTVSIGDGESSALELVVQMEGSFEEIQQFLTLMENVPYQSHLEDVRIQRVGQAEDSWQIMIQIIVYTTPQI